MTPGQIAAKLAQMQKAVSVAQAESTALRSENELLRQELAQVKEAANAQHLKN